MTETKELPSAKALSLAQQILQAITTKPMTGAELRSQFGNITWAMVILRNAGCITATHHWAKARTGGLPYAIYTATGVACPERPAARNSRAYRLTYLEKNRDMLAEKHRQYVETHREQINAYRRAYYHAHKPVTVKSHAKKRSGFDEVSASPDPPPQKSK